MAGGLWSETRVGSRLGQKGWPELIVLLVTAPPQPRTSEFFQGAPWSQLGSGPLARPGQRRAAFVPALPLPSFWPRAMAPCYLRLCSVTFCYKTLEVLRIGSPVITLPTTDCLSPGA